MIQRLPIAFAQAKPYWMKSVKSSISFIEQKKKRKKNTKKVFDNIMNTIKL